MVIQRHALEPQAQRLPVNGKNGFQGHERNAQQQRAQRGARQRLPAQRQRGVKNLRFLMIFNVHMQRVIRIVEAPVVDHVHRVEGGNVKRFFRRLRILSVDGIVMTFDLPSFQRTVKRLICC